MASGDLDGDTYLIIWEEDIISHMKYSNMEEPYNKSVNNMVQEEVKLDSDNYLDYPQMKRMENQVPSLADTVVYYLQNDLLGMIDVLHLAICDKKGLKHPDVDLLMDNHQLAVDFSKHGRQPNVKSYEEVS